MKRVPVQWVLVLALNLLLVGCESDPPIQIGLVANMTGRAADMGMSARNAVQLAVEQCNSQGGIQGRKIALVVRDDGQNAETAVQAVQELIALDVDAIVGPMISHLALAVVPVLNESRVLAVGPTVTTPRLSGRDDYFFRVCPAAREHAIRSARHQIRSGDMHRVSVAYDAANRSFSESWLEDFAKPFEAGGGKVLTAVAFSVKDGRTFSDIAGEMLAADPDGILIIANPMDSALLCQQIRKTAPLMKITLSNWGASRRLLELGGKAVEGVTVPLAFDWDCPNPAYREFEKVYSERYRREPGFSGAYAYDAIQVLLSALRSRKSGHGLKETLLSIGTFDGLQGEIRFDAYGDVVPTQVSIRMVRNRKFIVVE